MIVTSAPYSYKPPPKTTPLSQVNTTEYKLETNFAVNSISDNTVIVLTDDVYPSDQPTK